MKDERHPTMVATTAVLAVVAALFAAPANAVNLDVEGGGPTAGVAASPVEPGTIPYLSHGVGVDESLFSAGERSLGLTGDSALTRVSIPEPEGLTGDSALTRVERSEGPTASGADDDSSWTWVALGSGGGALLLAAMGAFAASTRQRGRVATP